MKKTLVFTVVLTLALSLTIISVATAGGRTLSTISTGQLADVGTGVPNVTVSAPS